MKAFLFIVLICSNLIAGSNDFFKPYATAIEKVDNIYKKAQYRHALVFKDQYIYEIFPTTMFPFFCAPADTVKKLLPYRTLYLKGTAIGLCLDKDTIKHISIAVLQYTKQGVNPPGIKIYTMYFFKMNFTTKDWDEDRVPITVTLYLKNDGSYMSK